MTTLAVNKARTFERGPVNSIPVIAADIVYQGAAVGDNGSGYGRPLVAGDPFRGFAQEKVDNSAGAAGDLRVNLLTEGIVELAISGLAITDVGKDVFASDDDTFTLTKGSNTRIGTVYRWVSSGVGMVQFNANRGRIALLTDNSGGTASDTIAAQTGAYVQATQQNTIASLTAKVNDLIRRQNSNS